MNVVRDECSLTSFAKNESMGRTQWSAGRAPDDACLEDAGTSQSRQSLLEMEQFGSNFAPPRFFANACICSIVSLALMLLSLPRPGGRFNGDGCLSRGCALSHSRASY